MHLNPRDADKLILHAAGSLAQKRLARGLRLNHPEAIALLATQLLEFIRDGRSVIELMDLGRRMLGRSEVLPGVPEMIDEVQVEGTFVDGTKLVTVHDPITFERGDLALALHGSFYPVPPGSAFAADVDGDLDGLIPGEYFVREGHVELNLGRTTLELAVRNTGDRPVQVGSHYPFVETNAALVFDRDRAMGMRLDIPAGTAIRFEPGDEKTVRLVATARTETDRFPPPGRLAREFDRTAERRSATSLAEAAGSPRETSGSGGTQA